MLAIALLVPVAYALGTFPSAAIVARTRGVDITREGSGNPGASNVGRVLGWRSGVAVFLLDALKGAIPAGAGLAVSDGRGGAYVLAAAAVVGHVFPAWRRFRGGKGVATVGGAMIVLHPVASAVLLVIWIGVSKATGKAALGSLAIAVGLPVAIALSGRPAWEIGAAAALAALVVVRHAPNVRRLLDGDELGLRSPHTPRP